MNEALASRVFPGAVLLIASEGKCVLERAWGHTSVEPSREASGESSGEPHATAVTTATQYDVASLTKAIATTTIAMRLFEAGRLDLEAPVQSVLGEFPHADVKVWHLLSHSSGLPAHRRYDQRVGNDRRAILAAASQEPLEYPTGTKSVYSDVGFLVLGALLERLENRSLLELFAPFAQDGLRYRPLVPTGAQPSMDHGSPQAAPSSTHQSMTSGAYPSATSRAVESIAVATSELAMIAPTEILASGAVLRGVVHDENARAMGGVAPHAGLFATADAIHRFVAGLLANKWVSEATRKRFWTRGLVPASSWRLGWDGPSETGYRSCGPRMPSPAVGHLGFTGCSLWIDPTAGVWIILLSNRVHPQRGTLDAIRAFRPVLHDVILADLGYA